MDQKKQKYYDQCSLGYERCYRNASFYVGFLEETEPRNWEEKMPTHGRIMNSKKAKAIMFIMVARLGTDVIRNVAHSWKTGTPLPSKNSYTQPLSESQNDAIEL